MRLTKTAANDVIARFPELTPENLASLGFPLKGLENSGRPIVFS